MDLDLELGRVANLSAEYLASVLPRVRLRRRIAPCAAKKPSAASAPATGCQCPAHHAGNSPFADGAVVQVLVGGKTAGRARRGAPPCHLEGAAPGLKLG